MHVCKILSFLFKSHMPSSNSFCRAQFYLQKLLEQPATRKTNVKTTACIFPKLQTESRCQLHSSCNTPHNSSDSINTFSITHQRWTATRTKGQSICIIKRTLYRCSGAHIRCKTLTQYQAHTFVVIFNFFVFIGV